VYDIEVLIAVSIKIKVLWVMTPYSLIDRYGSFGEKRTYLNLLAIRWIRNVGASQPNYMALYLGKRTSLLIKLNKS
jgi:hypothetical protein